MFAFYNLTIVKVMLNSLYHWLMPQPINKEQREMLIKLGERIRSIRHKKCLTLEEVASRIDKDNQSIQRLEKGGFNPSYIYLMEICKGLDIDIKDLFL